MDENKDKKIFYFDVETTGLNPEKNGIIQFGALIEINGKIVNEIDLKIAPFPSDVIEPEALKINGYTEDEIKGIEFGHPEIFFNGLIEVLAEHIDRYDRTDKFIVAGYNVSFDIGFLRAFFKKNGDDYYGSWFDPYPVDPYPVLAFMRGNDNLITKNLKLLTIAEYLGIEIKAHDALSDIQATRQIIKRLTVNLLKG